MPRTSTGGRAISAARLPQTARPTVQVKGTEMVTKNEVEALGKALNDPRLSKAPSGFEAALVALFDLEEVHPSHW
jgi:hypothetical protein